MTDLEPCALGLLLLRKFAVGKLSAIEVQEIAHGRVGWKALTSKSSEAWVQWDTRQEIAIGTFSENSAED